MRGNNVAWGRRRMGAGRYGIRIRREDVARVTCLGHCAIGICRERVAWASRGGRCPIGFVG